MGILIGMDEAGYGPNLGPLVVAATAWEVPDDLVGKFATADGSATKRTTSASASTTTRGPAKTIPQLDDHDLYRSLRRIVSRTVTEKKIAIADSKVLYKPGLGLRQLERGVHAVLAAIKRSASCWSEAVDSFGADPAAAHKQLCWHNGFNCPLPIDVTPDELSPLADRFGKECDDANIRPLALRARFVYPAEFNELTDRFESKGAALSHVTIGLLREMMDGLRGAARPTAMADSPTESRVFALCDKHGARNFYTGLLQHHFSEHWIEPIFESHVESRYEWGPPESRAEVVFRMQGEAFLPTALASMTAKYLRELAMRAFNEFWCSRVPGLRPTAGYPGDAPRFKQAISSLQRELCVADNVLWRNR